MAYYVGNILAGSELYHHGIKGQKWGVRRFQNPDGSLTSAGEQRYLAYAGRIAQADAYGERFRRQMAEAAGIRFSSDSSDVDVLKKGSSIGRYTNVEETVDNTRKYGFVSRDDESRYYDQATSGELPMQGDGDLRKETYAATRDLKIANQKAVTNYLVEKYGSTKVEDIAGKFPQSSSITKDLLKTFGKLTVKSLQESLDVNGRLLSQHAYLLGKSISKSERKELEYMSARASLGNAVVTAIMANEFYGGSGGKEMISHFAKRGFDAIADVEDLAKGMDYPIIFINPASSMKKVKSEKI